MKLNGILDYSMGNFLCLRGFAPIRDLARISDRNPAIQRRLIEEHRGEMADFLNRGEYIFFPEVILSLVLSDGTNLGELEEFWKMVASAEGMPRQKLGDFMISVNNRETKKEDNPYAVERVKVASITFNETNVRLNRIDGNHRLSAAEDVIQEMPLPYCILLFRTQEESERFSRAIFHNINSKQIPLKLEENLNVIITSPDVFSDGMLESDPSFGPHYRLARQLINNINFSFFPSVNTYISNDKYTFFVELFKFLLATEAVQIESAVTTVKEKIIEIEEALRESRITASTSNIAVIGALAFYKLTHQEKYRHFIVWIKKNHIGDVEMLHIEDVINIYDKVYLGCPRRAFLARWYPGETEAECADAEHRLAKIREVVETLGLELIDMGTRETGTFDIRSLMWESIEESDIFIADLTGARHNVMVEVGYALRHINTGRMVFYFQPTAVQRTVPFDLNGFMYDEINDSREIEQKVKPRLQSILERAAAGEL